SSVASQEASSAGHQTQSLPTFPALRSLMLHQTHGPLTTNVRLLGMSLVKLFQSLEHHAPQLQEFKCGQSTRGALPEPINSLGFRGHFMSETTSEHALNVELERGSKLGDEDVLEVAPYLGKVPEIRLTSAKREETFTPKTLALLAEHATSLKILNLRITGKEDHLYERFASLGDIDIQFDGGGAFIHQAIMSMAPPPKPPFLPKQQAIREMKIEKSEAETTWLAMKLTELDLQTRTAAPARFIKFGGLSGSTAREFEELSKSQSGLNAPVLDCIYKAMGDDAFKAGRHAEAAKFYKKGTKLTTPNAEACWSNRCLALIKIKRYEAALRAHKNATRLHARMHGPGIDEHYAKFDYRLGLILKALGMYERAEYHLMRSLRLDSQKSEVTKTALDQVRAQLEVLDTRYKGQRRSRGELDGRREESGNFTLSDEEIEMLFAAGAMPWDYGVEDILMAGRDIDEEEAKMLNYDTEEDAEKEGSLRAIIEGFEIERMSQHLENPTVTTYTYEWSCQKIRREELMTLLSDTDCCYVNSAASRRRLESNS
ncbi:hypothetical protein FRB90_007888, partial [Tulasnella sp. 427]